MSKYSVYMTSGETDEIEVEANSEDEAANLAIEQTTIGDPIVESVNEL